MLSHIEATSGMLTKKFGVIVFVFFDNAAQKVEGLVFSNAYFRS